MVVLIPEPGDPGEDPIKVSTIKRKRLALCKFATLTVVKPVPREATILNKALIELIKGDKPLSVFLYSTSRKRVVPKKTSVKEMKSTSFVCSEITNRFFRHWRSPRIISYHARKPKLLAKMTKVMGISINGDSL